MANEVMQETAVVNSENTVKLQKKDLIKSWLRWVTFGQTCYNYERMQGMGGANSMFFGGKSGAKQYVVDDKTVFIYAGMRDMEYQDRQQYKVYMRFTDELAGIDTRKYKLEVWSDGADDDPTTPEKVEGNNFKVLSTCYYETDEDYDVTRPYRKHEYITVYLNYSFEDYTTSPGQRLEYTVDGTLSMQRDLNTLIPDEDQQIQW